MIAFCGKDVTPFVLIYFNDNKRYLRATKWNSAKVAIERLEGTLKWRREFGVYDLTAEQVEPEVSSQPSLGWAIILTGNRQSRGRKSSLAMTLFKGPLST